MEIMDVVNQNDEVIDSVEREEIYSKLHLHRIVHVLVFNNQGKLALQQRSAKKSFAPLQWTSSAGGHVRSGESYEQAAKRELFEELGIKTPIKFLFKDFYSDYVHQKGLKKWLTTFSTNYEEPFVIDPDDIEKVEFFSLSEIKDMISKQPEKFHHELKFLFQEHYGLK